MSNIEMDLNEELDPCVVSVLQQHEIYFPPYTSEEIHNILVNRIRQGLYPGVLSDEMLDHVVHHTMQTGDLRVGIDLIRHAVLNAEHGARHEVTADDIGAAYDMARYVHLSACVRALTLQERQTLGHIAELSRGASPYMTSGTVYGMVKGVDRESVIPSISST